MTCLLIVVARRFDMIWVDSSDEIARGIKFSRALIRKDEYTRYHCQMCRFRTLRPGIAATKMFTNKFKSLFQKPEDERTCIFF